MEVCVGFLKEIYKTGNQNTAGMTQSISNLSKSAANGALIGVSPMAGSNLVQPDSAKSSCGGVASDGSAPGAGSGG